MPCYTTGSARGDAELAEDEARERHTITTGMLCATLLEFEKYEEFSDLPGDVKRWWAQHKMTDQKRRDIEAADRKKATLLRRAKRKLTWDERQALGLE